MPYLSNKGVRTAVYGLSILSSVVMLLSAPAFFTPGTTQASFSDTGRPGLPPEHHGRDKSSARLSKGVFLVATRFMRDQRFSGSVVLLLEYGQRGASGVIINRPTAMRLSEALPDVKGLEGRTDTLYFGGPVNSGKITTMLVRSGADPPPGSDRVLDDTYAVLSMDAIRRVVDDGRGGVEYRVFAGHAVWAPGQLDGEVSRGRWTVVRAATAEVFSDEPDKVWQRLRQRF